MMKKMIFLSMLSCIASFSFADTVIKPIIRGQTFNAFYIPVKTFGKPLKVIKGEEDECNGGQFPDKWVYDHFILLENGRIDKVYLKGNNAVKVNTATLDEKITEAQFKKKFSKFIFKAEPDGYAIAIPKDSNNAVTFYFKNNKLSYYQFSFDDC